MKNYFSLLVIGCIVLIFLGIVLFGAHQTVPSFSQKIEYLSLKSVSVISSQLANYLFLLFAENRFGGEFKNMGRFPTDFSLVKAGSGDMCLNRLWTTYEEWKSLRRMAAAYQLYRCGLLEYKQHNMEASRNYFELASLFGPEQSNFYLELASFYQLSGDPVQVDNVFSRCYKNRWSREMCFLVSQSGESYPIGYWSEEIQE